MKVKELIEKLQKLDQEAPIATAPYDYDNGRNIIIDIESKLLEYWLWID